MASRYIDDENFEVQVRNCFSSILNAIEAHHPFDRVTSLSKNDIIGLRLLEFRNFDSRIPNDEEIVADYRHTYRLNRRYALTVFGEYSFGSFIVIFMITDRQTNARFGFKVETSANIYSFKPFHIVVNIPIFGVHCVINYNPDTNFYVFSIRPPLSNNDIDMEITYATSNRCALICLEVDFARGNISYEIYNRANAPVFYIQQLISLSPERLQQKFVEMIDKEQKHCSAKFKIDSSFECEIGPGLVSEMLKALINSNFPLFETKTLTYKDVGGHKNFDLNLSCTFGKLWNAGKFDAENISGGGSYTYECNDSFDLTVSGELSYGTLTLPVILTHKKSGFSVGIQIEISAKPGLYIVIKIPGSNTEYVIKVNAAHIVASAGTLIAVIIRSKRNSGKKGGSKKGEDKKDDDNSNDENDNNSDEQNAAALGCDLIRLEVDLLAQTITKEVREYETIKEYAPNIEVTNDTEGLVNEQQWLVHVPEETLYHHEKQFQHCEEESNHHKEEFHRREEFSILKTAKKVAVVAMKAVDEAIGCVVETVKEVAVTIKDNLPRIALGCICTLGGFALAVGGFALATATAPLALPAAAPAFVAAPMMMIRRFF